MGRRNGVSVLVGIVLAATPHALALPAPVQRALPTGNVSTNPEDGQVMLLVPAGESAVGSDDGEADQGPAGAVDLPLPTRPQDSVPPCPLRL